MGALSFWTGPVLPSLPGITLAEAQSRVPTWNAVKQTALSGKRVRITNYSYPTYSYSLPIQFLRSTAAYGELQNLVAFINSLNGTVGLFGYSDPDDSAVVGQAFGEGTGSTASTFQLVRSFGGFTEPVFLIAPGGFHVYDAGVEVTSNVTLSPYGVVTFSTAPAAGDLLTWTGSYYWPCRFDEDTTDIRRFMNGLYDCRALKFSTEKLP